MSLINSLFVNLLPVSELTKNIHIGGERIRLWPRVVEGVWELGLDGLFSLKSDFVISLSNPHWESSGKEQTVQISGKAISKIC